MSKCSMRIDVTTTEKVSNKFVLHRIQRKQSPTSHHLTAIIGTNSRLTGNRISYQWAAFTLAHYPMRELSHLSILRNAAIHNPLNQLTINTDIIYQYYNTNSNGLLIFYYQFHYTLKLLLLKPQLPPSFTWLKLAAVSGLAAGSRNT